MSNETQGGVDYSAVIADLEARKAQIETAIAVLKTVAGSAPGTIPPLAISVGAPSAPNAPLQGPAGSPPNGSDIQSDTFFGLGIIDAARKYLGMRKRPTSAPEIMDALRKGGQINSLAEGFQNTLGSLLSRSDSKSGPIVRVGRGSYGLREWYSKGRAEAE